jgi:hypothetical protein
MRRLCVLVIALASATGVQAAPDVANTSQKGSLLVFPDVRVDGNWSTLIRIQNDGTSDVDIQCYWMDGNKNRVDFNFVITREQPFWFDARTGSGTRQVNAFPYTVANGFDNPYLLTPDNPATGPNEAEATEADPGLGPYFKGFLACWAVNGTGQAHVKWNHLSGTATVWSPAAGAAYEYPAYAFFVKNGLDLAPIGAPNTLRLDGNEYDACPLYLVGQFTPVGPFVGSVVAPGVGAPSVRGTRLAVVGCTLRLNQDWFPVYTKLQFDVWNEDEVKFTGAYECADSWHEVDFNRETDTGSQNFWFDMLSTFSARYRVESDKSTQCPEAQLVGLLGVQSTILTVGEGTTPVWVGTPPASAGKVGGRIIWDPALVTPEGGLR